MVWFLAILGGIFLVFLLVVLIIALWITPRLVGTLHVIDSEGARGMYVALDSEEDFEKLKKYNYVVLKSGDYKSQ